MVAVLSHHLYTIPWEGGSLVFTKLLDNSQAWMYTPAWLLFCLSFHVQKTAVSESGTAVFS